MDLLAGDVPHWKSVMLAASRAHGNRCAVGHSSRGAERLTVARLGRFFGTCRVMMRCRCAFVARSPRIRIWTVSRSVSMDCLALMERPLLVKRWSSAGREHLDTSRRLGRCAERYDSFSFCQRYGTSWSAVAGRWSSSCAGVSAASWKPLEVDGLSARESHNWNFFFFAATQRLRASLHSRGGGCRLTSRPSWQ